MAISIEGLPRTTVINTGQHILIEGGDEDNPYVAKVVRLFGDSESQVFILAIPNYSPLNIHLHCVAESGEQKKATVQWFVRVSEVPPNKLKLLGREPHPQEIFYYEGRGCDDEVDAESILRPVQVRRCYPNPPGFSVVKILLISFSVNTRKFN